MGEAQARAFMQWLPKQGLLDLRDRAFIACMLYSFGRVSAIAGMRRRDWTMDGAQWALLLDEKGGNRRTIHAHHKIIAAMHACIEVGELEDVDPESPLFRASNGRSRSLSERPFRRVQAWKMVKRRIAAFADERRAAGERLDLSRITCHSFRAIGITSYLNNGGRIEFAQRMAGHSSPRTTELYHHGARHIALEEYERIRV